MAKAISSATDVLAAIAGKAVPFETNGVTVEVRALQWEEVQVTLAQHKDNDAEFMFQMALAGLSEPKLTEEQLRKARVSFVTDIGRRVLALSGLTNESAGPLAGTGSSLPLATDQPS